MKTLTAAALLLAAATPAQSTDEPPAVPAERLALWQQAAEEMKPYTATIPGTEVTFDMVPIPGGRFRMGAPEGEAGRRSHEGPLRWVAVDPFWLGRCEVTWDEYEQWASSLEVRRRPDDYEATPLDVAADAVSRPTPPYTDMTFGLGRDGFPAICMTQHAAVRYCEWLAAKLGCYHRLPTEAEWEYACRAGTATAFSFGNDDARLGEFAWFRDNAPDGYARVGTRKPNPWGLHDMHGNVSEWVMDGFADYAPADGLLLNPLVPPGEDEYPRAVRGGSWKDRASRLRSAARRGSSAEWKMQDPQIPQSVWYFTDAQFNGFRVLRPYVEPSDEERARFRSNIVEHDR